MITNYQYISECKAFSLCRLRSSDTTGYYYSRLFIFKRVFSYNSNRLARSVLR
jgi:hypothetical protein